MTFSWKERQSTVSQNDAFLISTTIKIVSILEPHPLNMHRATKEKQNPGVKKGAGRPRTKQ